MRKRVIAGRLLLLAQIVLVCVFWFWNHAHSAAGSLFAKGAPEVLLAAGRLAALVAAMGILLQLVLIGRIKWVEQSFGLDRLFRVHHKNGLLVLGALLAHPILITAGHAMKQRSSIWVQLKEFFTGWDALPLAAAGWFIFLTLGALSVPQVRRHMRYERWHATHLTSYVAIVLAFFHQTTLGMDFTKNHMFAAYWFVLHGCVAAGLIFYRFLTPILLFRRHRFAVERLEQETDDVISVVIRGRNLAAFRIRAGQFMFVRFWAKPFWLSSSPWMRGAPQTTDQFTQVHRRTNPAFGRPLGGLRSYALFLLP